MGVESDDVVSSTKGNSNESTKNKDDDSNAKDGDDHAKDDNSDNVNADSPKDEQNPPKQSHAGASKRNKALPRIDCDRCMGEYEALIATLNSAAEQAPFVLHEILRDLFQSAKNYSDLGYVYVHLKCAMS